MSTGHLERLKMWPEIAGMIRASDEGIEMEERIALADDWIAKYGPGPYELDQRQDPLVEVLGWSSLDDLSGDEHGGSWSRSVGGLVENAIKDSWGCLTSMPGMKEAQDSWKVAAEFYNFVGMMVRQLWK